MSLMSCKHGDCMKVEFYKVLLLVLLVVDIKISSSYLGFDNCIQAPPNPKEISQDIPEPYASLALWPLNLGMCLFRDANKNMLELFIQKYKPKIIVEVGSFLGVSTIFMASSMPSEGKLYAIDSWLWDGVTPKGIIMYSDANKDNQGYQTSKTYEQFLSNVKHYNLTEVIIPIRSDSIEASRTLDVTADLIYIDADHSEEAVFKDILSWYPKLSEMGIICGDDWLMPTVRNGVIRAARRLKKKIKFEQNFWYFVF